MMSSEEGVSILNKFCEESSKLFVTFTEKGRSEKFAGSVMKVESGVLVLSKYEVGSFLLNLGEVESFRFSDPREAVSPGQAAKSLEFCLQLTWPNGAICRLYKVRDDFDMTD